uniref:Uncharacterized protein n=1 Tax=viral metagenome TaxID=1070528 RepID=A0A6M3M7W6_9ZZZZ
MAEETIAYQFKGLIGGGGTNLDGVDGRVLKDGDFAYIMLSGNIQYNYMLDASSGLAEKVPFVIEPDVNADNKRWILQTPYVAYVDATAPDQGAATAEGYRSLKDLIDAIGLTKKATIVCPSTGTGDTTIYTLTTNETVPANITLKMEQGVILDGAGTLTINGSFEHGLYQVFGASITVVFGSGSVKEVYPEWWGAVGDDATDDHDAFVAANASFLNGGFICLLAKSYRSKAFTLSDYVSIKGLGKKSVLKRYETGDFITRGSYSVFRNFVIDGDTAALGNGKGVLIPSGKPQQRDINLEITNFVEPCLEFAADGGSGFVSDASTYYTTGVVGTVAAVKVNGIDTAARPRKFVMPRSEGCTLFDFGGSDDFMVVGGFTNGLIFSADTSKASLAEMRWGALGGTVTIAGSAHKIWNITSATDITVTATDSYIAVQAADNVITDNGTGNKIFNANLIYTPTWTADTVNPAIGNGTLTATSTRMGDRIEVNINVTMGGTTTYGTGKWFFSLPRADNQFYKYTGTYLAYDDNTGDYYTGVAYVVPSLSKVMGLGNASPAVLLHATSPITWAENDILIISINYLTT